MAQLGTSQQVLDVRAFSAGDRRTAVFSAFDALSPGESFVLVSARDPRPVLDDLRAERKGLFEWSPLDEDPRCWHVEVARRDAAPGALRRVTEALTWDHARLDALERSAFAALAEGGVETARRLYRAFHHGLNRHIRCEEELLFPVFEARSGLPRQGPTSVMRAEHREIRMLLEGIARSLDGSADDVEELRRDLRRVLEDHDRKEEAILYPAMDRLLSDAESDALVGRVQAFPS